MLGGKGVVLYLVFSLLAISMAVNVRGAVFEYPIPNYNEMPEMYREVVNEVISNEIYYELSLDDIYINETGNYSEIVLGDFFSTHNFGEPMLPMKFFEIPIPSDMKSFTIEIVNPAYTEVNINKKIKPFVPEDDFFRMTPRYEIYENYSSSPDKITVDFGYRGEQKYALVRYYPFGYDSENDKLNVTTKSILKIGYSEEEYVSEKVKTTATMEALSDGQGPEVEWEKTFGGMGSDVGYSVQQTSDGGYIIAGYTESFGAGAQDVYLIKIYPNGSIQWNKTFGGNEKDLSFSLQQTSDNGYIIAGYTNSSGVGGYDVYLIKTYPDGSIQWNKTFGGNNTELGYSVQQTSDGGYILAGYTSSFGAGSSDAYLIKTDSNGDEQWNKTFGGNYLDQGYSVQQTLDGGYIVAGVTNSFGLSSIDVYLIKTDSNGNMQWNKTYGDSGFQDWGYYVQQTSDGGYIIAGFIQPAGYYVYSIKTDSDGSIEWDGTFSTAALAYSVDQTLNMGYIMAGWRLVINPTSEEVLIIAIDSDGKEKWEKLLGGSGRDIGQSVQQTFDEGYIIAGFTNSFGAGDDDAYLIKLKKEDTCLNGIKDEDETDVDCGGSCSACEDGKDCLVDSDCQSNYCNPSNICATLSCDDGLRNGDEIGIDCGGSCPNKDCCNNGYEDENLGEEGVDCGPLCTYSCITPVMLVHGYLSDPEIDWALIKNWLENDNYAVGLVDLTLQTGFASDDIKEYAKWLRTRIRYEKTTNRAKNVDIIGYDMGGLVARWYVNALNATDVRNIYLIGTPNHGSELFYPDKFFFLLDWLAAKLGWPAEVILYIVKYIRGEASQQMLPHSDFLNELNYGDPEADDGIDYLAAINTYLNIAGDNSTIVYDYMGNEVQNNPLKKPHDNFVTVESVRLDNLGLSVYPLNHLELTKSLEIYNQIKSILESFETMSIQLLEMLEASEQEVDFHRGPLISGEISTNEDKIYYADIDGTVEEAQFILGHFIANISLILTMPNGSMINTKTIKDNPKNAFINRTFLAGYHIDKPGAGKWRVNISCEDAENGKINFSLYIFLKTNISLEINLSKYHYDLNEQINLTAELKEGSNPIIGATVTAKIKKQDDSIEVLELYDDGSGNDIVADDGIYNNFYIGTDIYGRYDITITANGTRDGLNFSREEFVSVWVEDYPDLVVKNISFSNSSPMEGDNITINALIENIGEKDAINATIEFYHSTKYEDEFIGEDNISVGIGEIIEASVNWTNLKEGNYNVTVLISPFNSFLEGNYSNNLAIESIKVEAKLLFLYNLFLNQGWNLISVPLDLPETNISAVFNKTNISIFGYNGSWFVPTEIDNKLGYWLKINESRNLTVMGTEIENPTIELNEGWNLIGYPSLNITKINETLKDVNYSVVYGYNGSWLSYVPNRSFNSLQALKPGYGYWVNVR